jgi:hypothetical protein
VRTDQHISVPTNVLVRVEELAAVRYANECTTSFRLGGGRCKLCWRLRNGDDSSVVGGNKALFHVGEAVRLHVSRRSSFPRRRIREVSEDVKEDSPVLGDELGTWVLVSARHRGKNLESGYE